MIQKTLMFACALFGFSVCKTVLADDPVDGALIEIGDDNDADGGPRHVGLINLLDDKDPGGTVHDGRGALIEVGPDNNPEDGTLLDLLDNEGLIRLLGNNLLGGGGGGLLGGAGGLMGVVPGGLVP